MFSMFSKSEAKTNTLNIFTEDDIREILGSFTLDPGGKTSGSEGLILSTSKANIIRKEELVDAVKDQLDDGQDALSLKSIADKHEVDPLVLHDLLASKDWAFFSADNSSILTRKAQEEIISLISKITAEAFQITSELSEECNIRTETLLRLLKSHGDDVNTKNQHLIFDPASSLDLFKSWGILVYSSSLLEDVKVKITDSIDKASKSSEPVSWKAASMHRLSAAQFEELAKEVSKDHITSSPGIFSLDRQAVIFTPAKSLLLERDQKLDNVSSGKVPHLNLKDIIGTSPGEFPDLYVAQEFVTKKYNAISVSNSSIVSNVWVHQRLDETCTEARKKGHAALKNILSPFIKDSINTVNALIDSKLDLVDDIVRAGDYIAEMSWISDIEAQVQTISTTLAESIWEKDDQPRPKSSALDSRLKDMLVQKLKLEKLLVDALWTSKDCHLASKSVLAFDTKLEELDISSDDQFNSLWSSRVVSKIELYEKGLSEIPDQTFRDQLADLLKSHISSELIPLAANRAKAKGLLKSPRRRVASRLAKLQTSLLSKRDYVNVLEELEKFNNQMEIPDSTDTQLGKAKTTYLKDMNKTMSKDEDGARLFVCLLIVLFSSLHDGILYATGKFAPKILKMLKPQFSPDDAQWLDQVKDSIKAGNTTDEMKSKMRLMASQKLQLVADAKPGD